jgi:hypothetical protein
MIKSRLKRWTRRAVAAVLDHWLTLRYMWATVTITDEARLHQFHEWVVEETQRVRRWERGEGCCENR